MILLLYEIPRIGKFIVTECRLGLSRGWGWTGNGEVLLNGYGVSICSDEKVLKIVVMVAQHCECN